jgi:Ni/Co efflux regulator RcnB
MKNKIVLAIAAATLLISGAMSASAAHARSGKHVGWAQDQGANHHWRSGERIGANDWQAAQPVDYRQHRLRHPPRGYEWRESNGQFVLVAITTGLIASTLIGR